MEQGQGDLPTLRPEAKPQRGAAHERLAVFVGDWYGDGLGGDAPMTTLENYDWVEGGFFLVTSFNQTVGSAAHIGVGTIGYDVQSGTYSAHMVDNLGYDRIYELIDRGDGVWSLIGERERATLTFRGDRLSVRWEHRPDGGAWMPLCEYASRNERKTAVH
jgi:hypothetical protein